MALHSSEFVSQEIINVKDVCSVVLQPDIFQQLQQQPQQQRILHVGGNTSSANNPQLRHLLQLQQQMLMQQRVPGQRPPMAPGQIGQPGMVTGSGQQPPNPGSMFGDDLM